MVKTYEGFQATLEAVDTNTYFIENDKAVILIDPSGESEKLLKIKPNK